jgi:adenylate cyclase
MADEGFKRKLTAILNADVEGYSRLMDDDEEATVRTLTSYRTAIADLVQQFRGRVVDTPGDNILADFTSVVDAVNCAVEIQRDLAERNTELPDNRQMQFRIGVNLGDVIDEDGRIYGDGVNIAARVESLSEAGGICISGRAHDQVENKLGLEYEDLGKHQVKNITRPIQVYRVLSHPGAAAHRVVQAKETLGRKWRNIGIAAAALVVAAVVTVTGWQIYQRQSKKVDAASLENMAYPLPDNPSIAVLPFVNISGDPKQEYFSDGFTEQIIASLSMVPKVFVIARNSTFTYKDKAVKVQQVAEELGVRYVLEGSIQKEGQRVRITAQLIDAITGRHLWAKTYDRELKDIFALQDEITIRIITELRVKLTDGEQARVLSKGTKNLQAYLKYLQAKEYLQLGTKENNALARRLYEEAIAIDPEFPQAYSSLGVTYMMDIYLGSSKSPKLSLEKAVELNKKAIALNDSIPLSHSRSGWLYVLAGKHDKAIAECERAISLDPNSAQAHLRMGFALRYAGRHEEAVRSSERALRLDPIPPSPSFRALGLTYIFVGKYEEAIAAFKKSLDRSPNDSLTHFSLACVYSLADRNEDAQAEAQKVLQINPNFSLKHFAKRLTYKNQADKELIVGAASKAGLPE